MARIRDWWRAARTEVLQTAYFGAISALAVVDSARVDAVQAGRQLAILFGPQLLRKSTRPCCRCSTLLPFAWKSQRSSARKPSSAPRILRPRPLLCIPHMFIPSNTGGKKRSGQERRRSKKLDSTDASACHHRPCKWPAKWPASQNQKPALVIQSRYPPKTLPSLCRGPSSGWYFYCVVVHSPYCTITAVGCCAMAMTVAAEALPETSWPVPESIGQCPAIPANCRCLTL